MSSEQLPSEKNSAGDSPGMREFDATVIGGSLTAFAAALDLAEVGLRVAFIETDEPQAKAQAVRDHTGCVRSFLDRIARPLSQGSADREDIAPVVNRNNSVAVLGRDGQPHPLPEPNMFGIPATPLNERVPRLIGQGASFRAYLDRILPVLTVGKQESLWKLVVSRMGHKLAQTLVRPLLAAEYGVPVEDIETSIAAPGLNEALTRAGSLSGGVLALADRWEDHRLTVRPRDGWEVLYAAARDRLSLYQTEQFFNRPTRVRSVEVETSESAPQSVWDVQLDDGQVVRSRALVIDRESAETGAIPGLEEPHMPVLRTVASATVSAVESNSKANIASANPKNSAACEFDGGLVLQVPPAVKNADANTKLGSSRSGHQNALATQDTAAVIISRESAHTLRVEFLLQRQKQQKRAQVDNSNSAEGAAGQSADALAMSETANALFSKLGLTPPVTAWEWNVTHRAARFARDDERQQTRLAVNQAQETAAPLRFIGELYHGGDVSDALHHVPTVTHPLRRVLTGIADS
jgi:hypothetical protein